MKWEVLLVKRKIYPEIGKWCAIGGRVLKGEHFKTAITRQAKRELGVTVSVLSPWSPDKPVWIYNDPKADPQKHIIALVYPVIIKHGEIHSSGPEFSRAKWFPITRLPKDMGFGHDREIKAVEQALQML